MKSESPLPENSSDSPMVCQKVASQQLFGPLYKNLHVRLHFDLSKIKNYKLYV